MIGRPKGGTNRYWTKDEKLRIVNRVLNNHEPALTVSESEHISNGMLSTWIKRYLKNGTNSLENKIKPGNPMAKYTRRKELTNMEQIQYENMKLRIENERLKKGYIVKGVGQEKEFISLSNKNTK